VRSKSTSRSISSTRTRAPTPNPKSLGACPLHLSTYDLTRHGILISGQAYQSLPQVLLELEGDDIYAVGVFGLIFGRFDNLQG
jgi:arsenite oxidase small subunit